MSKTSVKPSLGCLKVLSVQFTAKLLAMKSDSSQIVFECGSISIEPQTGMVKNPSECVRLGPVNMQVLVTLLESSGEVVSRAEIFDRVWKNQVISDDSLTRCISDLRTQLRVFSEFENAIETLPKRGYRWLPKLNLQSQALPVKQSPEIEQAAEKNTWRYYLTLTTLGVLMLFLLSTSVLWLTERIIRPDLIRVALLPIQSQQPAQQATAQKMNELLKAQLLETDNLRFLSNSAIEQRPDNPFPYFTRQFGTQWIIEGKIRNLQDKLKISLDLVDARTAMVSFTVSREIENNPEALEKITKDFVKEMVRILGIERTE